VGEAADLAMGIHDGKIRLRPGTAADRAFLRRVHRESMRPHVESTWGFWDEDLQRRRFDESTDPATHEIIEYDGAAVGCQWVRFHSDSVELVRLYLLPEFQGRGIGTHLVAHLCDRSGRLGLPVRLKVLRVNRAQQLYRRLGFTVIGETDTHLLMERAASWRWT
jgi:ribosomal protein S18 acetylase RimI-like enzyme